MVAAGVPAIIWPNRLRELREGKSDQFGRKIFLEEVATACGCSIGNLSRIEKGYVRPSDTLLNSLAAYYGVPSDSIRIDTPVANRLDETSIIGAYIRKRRLEMGDSLSSLARKIEKASGQSVSDSLMRLIETGRRAFKADDSISNAIVGLFRQGSLDQLRATANDAFANGDLAEILDKLHGGHGRPVSEIPLFADGRAGELPIPTPALLVGRVKRAEREYAVRLDIPALGPSVPPGSYLVGQAGMRPLDMGLAIMWDGPTPQAVRVFHDQVKGLLGLREKPRSQVALEGSRRVDRVVAVIMPE